MIFGHGFIVRAVYSLILLAIIAACIGAFVVLKTKQSAFSESSTVVLSTEPFPISVNPIAKRIEPSTIVDEYHEESLASITTVDESWLTRLTAVLAPHNWYQQLASPVSRIFVIWPGERKEEVGRHIAGIVRWNADETQTFIDTLTNTEPVLSEGTFYPGRYVTHRSATPEEIATLINERFVSEIDSRYTEELEAIVPLEDALILASLIEREASDFENMREVSGVIWNRLFVDMPLQLDATLQYARGSNPSVQAWWPVVRPADKFVDSPYNTYQNAGLPPAPIANVTAEAVLAALNPLPTNCLFYFHDSNRGYHCSETYEEHVAKLKAMYGRGS